MPSDQTIALPSRDTIENFEILERINAAIVGASSSDELLGAVLDELLDIFSCDRAWLLYPCTLEAEWFQVPLERSRPDYPGAGATMEQVPMDDFVAEVYRLALSSAGPVAFDGISHSVDVLASVRESFHVKTQLVMAIHPKGDTPWMLGIHHCRGSVVYGDSVALFQAIGRRVADGLTMMIAMQELRQSEQRFRTLVEHAPEAIVIFDVDRSRYVDANPNAEKLFGRTREELLELSPQDVSPEFQSHHRESGPLIMGNMRAAIAGEFPCFEWEVMNAAGERICCEVRLARLPHPTQILVRGSMTDISERRKETAERKDLESRLAQSQKMEAIGNLTGGIAHDFNNLLTVVFGNLELLDHASADPAFVKQRLANIRVAAERAGSLTHRLLAFARRQPLRPTTVDIARLVFRMEELLRPTLGETIDIEIAVAEEIGACVADEAQLENAILNLAINARDAMPEGGRLRIAASNVDLAADDVAGHDGLREGAYVLISATDNGAGMPPELLDQIFAPFFTTKELGKGTGLGLSMVYGFVRQSEGHIEAESSVGEGTTMKIYLPRATDGSDFQTPSNASADEELALGNGERVLVVEDNDSVRQLTRLLLAELGYETCEARTAREALKELKDNPRVELLLTDVVLPDGNNGAELANQAKELRPDLHVLFMSGYTEDANAMGGTLPADVHLLEKPFTKSRLAKQVREALQSPEGV